MPKPQTVLCFDNSFTFGGAINALEDLLSGVDRARFTPLVVSAQPQTFLDSHFDGIPTIHWPVRLPWVHDRIHRVVTQWPPFDRGPMARLWGKGRAAGWLAFYWIPEAVRLARFARSRQAALIHLNNGVESLVPPLLAARLLRLPVVAHARGPQDTRGIARLWARMADHWISVSASVADNLREAGVPEERITVIHDAIDLSEFSEVAGRGPAAAQFGLPADAPVFGIFARIIPWKGIREFILAARLVMDRVPNARALVVGDRSDGSEEYYEEVVALAHTLGIADRVQFTGFREDVADVMRACDVVVHASTFPEPFGLTVVEAMATGRAVVAANAGGPTETVVHGDSGLLVDPTDADALSAAIIELLENRERAAEMGRRAAHRAREMFSVALHAGRVQAVYDRVLAERGG